MLLYVLYDSKNKTLSLPLLSPNYDTIKQSLTELNPENLSDLTIISIVELNHPFDLLKLRLDQNVNLNSLYPFITQVE